MAATPSAGIIKMAAAILWMLALTAPLTNAATTISKIVVASSDDQRLSTEAKEAFGTTASTAGLPLHYSAAASLTTAHMEGAATVVLGSCSAGRAALVKRPVGSRIPILLLMDEPCGVGLQGAAVLPLYQLQDSKTWSCLVPVLGSWLDDNRNRDSTGGGSMAGFLRHALPARRNLAQDYLDCGGLPSPAPRTTPPGMTRLEQLQLGREYLNGKDLVIATLHRPPFVILEFANNEEDILSGSGFCLELIKALAEKYNFTYQMVLPYDGNWGNAMPNGTFNGMVGMVARQWVDMAMASFTITQSRATVVDFTHAFYEEPTTILIPMPREKSSALACFEPFSYQVWMLILGSILLVGPLLWLITEGTGDWAPILYPKKARRASVLRFMWDAGFALTAQSNRMRLNESSRVLLGMWWTYAIILIYTYTGTLIASLTVPRMASLIESLEELASQREVLWTYRANTAHDKLFAKATMGTYQKIGQLMREQDLMVHSDKEGFNKVLQHNMAFIKEKSLLDFAMERDYLDTGLCRYAQVPQLFFSASFGWPLEQDSAFLPIFNTEILRLMQTGLVRAWQKKYWPKPNKCTASATDSKSRGPRALRLKDLGGHFLIFGVGNLMGLAAFLMEKLYRRFCASANYPEPVAALFQGTKQEEPDD